MGNLYIFEGPDGSGKTTLAEHFIKQKTTLFIHNGVYPSPEAAYLSFKKQLELSALWQGNVVIDRLHWSEKVYSEAQVREPLSQEKYDELEDMIQELRGTMILCLPDYEICFHNWSKRNEMNEEYIKKEEIYQKVYNGYHLLRIKNGTKLNAIKFDYLSPNGAYEQIIRSLI